MSSFGFHKLSRSKSASKKERSWILDGIVGYLQSPVWHVPIMNFVDEHCSCFENKDENKFEYTDIHNAYKKLIEDLLANYIKELNISVEAFAEACNQDDSSVEKVEGIFEYMWAADDFLLFKRIMIKHNLELDVQAAQDLQVYDVQSKSAAGSNQYKDVLRSSEDEYTAILRGIDLMRESEERDLKVAIEYSRKDMEMMKAQAEEEERMLNEAIKLSLLTSNDTSTTNTSVSEALKVEVPSLSKQTSAKEPKDRPSKEPAPKASVSSLPPLRRTTASAANDWINKARNEINTTVDVPQPTAQKQAEASSALSASEIEQRKQYLKNQRDKILEQKRKNRQTELKEFKNNQSESPNQANQVSNPQDEKEGHNARLALAARLKREVIRHKKN